MIQIAPRDKKVLIVGGVFIVLYLLFVLIAQPAFRENKLASQKIQDKILFIQKCYEILNQKSYYKAKSTENKSIHTTLSQRFLNQAKPALAAAEQQRSKLRDLTNFIHRLENNQKFMVIEEISVQRTNKVDLEELQTQLTVSGFIKKMEEEKTKVT